MKSRRKILVHFLSPPSFSTCIYVYIMAGRYENERLENERLENENETLENSVFGTNINYTVVLRPKMQQDMRMRD